MKKRNYSHTVCPAPSILLVNPAIAACVAIILCLCLHKLSCQSQVWQYLAERKDVLMTKDEITFFQLHSTVVFKSLWYSKSMILLIFQRISN
jgi:hypothetical protein